MSYHPAGAWSIAAGALIVPPCPTAGATCKQQRHHACDDERRATLFRGFAVWSIAGFVALRDGDCDAALSTALSRLLTMPSAGSEKRVVASGSMFCCCTGMTVVAFVLTLSSLRVRSSNCCVGGAGEREEQDCRHWLTHRYLRVRQLSEALTSTGEDDTANR